jgi:hypothetical protein
VGRVGDKLPRDKLPHVSRPMRHSPSISSVPIVAWRYVARADTCHGATVECAMHPLMNKEAKTNKRAWVLLWAVLVALPAPLEWAQLRATSIRLVEHSDDAVHCAGHFALAMRGPCDAQGPCSNPSHGHHGHQHESPARPCIVGSAPRPTPATLVGETVPVGLLLVLRPLVLPADEAPIPICLVRPAGRAPPAALLA